MTATVMVLQKVAFGVTPLTLIEPQEPVFLNKSGRKMTVVVVEYWTFKQVVNSLGKRDLRKSCRLV